MNPFPKNNTGHKWFVWTPGKHHQRLVNTCSCTVGQEVWCGKTTAGSSGVLGLTNPQTNAKTEYNNSMLITAKLTNQIYNQKLNLEYYPLDQQYIRTTKSKLQQEKTKCRNCRNKPFGELYPESQQLIKRAMEKGTSSWLSALPIKAIGYALNKQEFMDAMNSAWYLDGRWRAYSPMCLWRDKLCRSQPHL